MKERRQEREEERRIQSRFSVYKDARCILKEKLRGWEKCTIIDVSRNGMGLIFHTREKINVGLTVYLEIVVQGDINTINVVGGLKWIGPKDNELIGGIELTGLLDNTQWSKLF
jgi:hypothetical protein